MELEGIRHRRVKVNGITMHVAEKGVGPVILFLHGFPELWYCWRHQINALASLGYRAVAPDLRGYGETDAPDDVRSYTCLHVVGDIIGLLDLVAPNEEKVFVVAHDWGAYMAWFLCLFRPDRVKALVNLSVVFDPFDPATSVENRFEALRAFFGNDYYMCRFQEPGEIEAEFAEFDTETVFKELMTLFCAPYPVMLQKGKLFEHPPDTQITLPNWLTDEDVKYYSNNINKKGFTGGINYYRNISRNEELCAAWNGSRIEVPVKFMIGDQDLTYNMPGVRDYLHKGGLKRDVPLLEEVVVMEGVGHYINEEKPEDTNKHIHDFFTKF